ncbi:uncharacterized protein [Physcomitrium patens]|uniref:uncharacterized protein isoform X2 n=1 Tax=Physcomitrium patens TaxID=3218 RepID=UPI003CCD4765
MVSTMSTLQSRLPREMPVRIDVEKSRRGILAFRSQKLEFVDAKVTGKGDVATRKRKSDTPDEVYLSLPKKTPAHLPEKFALLESFYEGVEAAVSLLGIRCQLCTFQAVCATVEATTKRRFLQKHLAQIKHILPEAVDLEYVRLYDQESYTRKWELKIALLPMPAEETEPIRDGKCTSKKPKIESVQRRRVFHTRLARFAVTHSEDDDIPAHPMPERPFNGNSTFKRGFTDMPVAMTCIPMGINITAHRVVVPESTSGSPQYSASFKSGFLQKAGNGLGSFIRGDEAGLQESTEVSHVLNSTLPMPINRTSHRDVHNFAKKPLGTPHLEPSFKAFFSIKSRSAITEVADENYDDPILAANTPNSSQTLSPVKRRHVSLQEEVEIVAAVEPQTPVKIARTCGTPARLIGSKFESPIRQCHHSTVAKLHFSTRSSSTSLSQPDSCCTLGSAVEPSVSKDISISWDVRTPVHVSNAAEQCSPEEEESFLLKTPVKSTIPARSFRSPASVTPTLQYTPCTPHNNERGCSSIYVSYHAGEPEGACPEGFKSPAATPVKGGSTSLRTPVNSSRTSRFRNKQATKLNLGPIFARTSDEDASADSGGTHTGSGTSLPKKSLCFTSEVSQADMLMIQGIPSKLVNSVLREELRVAEENRDDVVALRRHQQMKAGITLLFDQLRLIVQSSNKSVFPCKKLLSKLVSSNTEMTDRTEVEVRLNLLMELAPEWISAKPSLAGDTLYRIDKNADVMGVRKRLCSV